MSDMLSTSITASSTGCIFASCCWKDEGCRFLNDVDLRRMSGRDSIGLGIDDVESRRGDMADPKIGDGAADGMRVGGGEDRGEYSGVGGKTLRLVGEQAFASKSEARGGVCKGDDNGELKQDIEERGDEKPVKCGICGEPVGVLRGDESGEDREPNDGRRIGRVTSPLCRL